MRVLSVLAAVSALAAPTVCLGQVTQSYTYDANGRLTAVTTSDGVSTHASAYAYDQANNRTSRSRLGTTVWAAIERLPAGQWLQPDEALVSPEGRYSLAMRPSGRLELWFGEAPTPLLAGAPSLGDVFHLGKDGQARFLPASLETVVPEGAWVALRDDGALVLMDRMGSEVWRSGDVGQEVAR